MGKGKGKGLVRCVTQHYYRSELSNVVFPKVQVLQPSAEVAVCS
jgi:hypothetical protein